MTRKGKILVVDDNEDFLLAIKLLLKPYFETIRINKSPHQIPKNMAEEDFDVIMLDMNFSAGINSGNEGLYWMQQIFQIDPQAVIILITAYAEVDLAVKAMQQGATSFLQKGANDEQVISTVLQAYEKRSDRKKIDLLTLKQQHLNERLQTPFFTGESAAMRDTLDVVNKVAPTDANLLITGESGTGKSLLAAQIHQLSHRKHDLLVTIDLAALPENLLESELFGHKKGAFTDAREDKPGKIEIASGGTLFFDEIGNIPLHYQTKLLSVLQNREVYPLGAVKPVNVDVRVISATNFPMEKLHQQNMFREDLLYRLNTITLEIPPLRNRKEDIPLLANHFLQKYASHYHKNEMKLSKSAITRLQEYSWPGNVRELQHTLEKAVILSDHGSLIADDFQLSHTLSKPTGLNLATHEEMLINQAISESKGNMSLAAKKLGITRATLYNKIGKYGIKQV